LTYLDLADLDTFFLSIQAYQNILFSKKLTKAFLKQDQEYLDSPGIKEKIIN
tara:strand:- start:1023 stop:1178 length:156 start_codon:yes stop_codon:yes gene_type:complete